MKWLAIIVIGFVLVGSLDDAPLSAPPLPGVRVVLAADEGDDDLVPWEAGLEGLPGLHFTSPLDEFRLLHSPADLFPESSLLTARPLRC